jgi:hypothetical protein
MTALYPHLELEENRRELEREQKLRRQIDKARLEAKERCRSSRTPLLSRLRRASRPRPACSEPKLGDRTRYPRDEEAPEMKGVIVEFQYGDEFEPDRIAAIAREARGRFEALPGLRQKAFTVDEANRRAMNVYLWDSEELARGFFTEELVERVAVLYGLRPSVSFVEVAELVENS